MLPSIGVYLQQLAPETKVLTRKLERTKEKLLNCSYGVIFIKTCISENLLPHFTDINPYDPVAKE